MIPPILVGVDYPQVESLGTERAAFPTPMVFVAWLKRFHRNHSLTPGWIARPVYWMLGRLRPRRSFVWLPYIVYVTSQNTETGPEGSLRASSASSRRTSLAASFLSMRGWASCWLPVLAIAIKLVLFAMSPTGRYTSRALIRGIRRSALSTTTSTLVAPAA